MKNKYTPERQRPGGGLPAGQARVHGVPEFTIIADIMVNHVTELSQLLQARKILVLGPSGAGKTRFSIKLGKILKLDVIHLDARFWKQGWISTPTEEWRTYLTGLIRERAWIMDGTYESTLDIRLPAADCIFYIHGSRFMCLWRVWKRIYFEGVQARPDAPAGQKLDAPYFRYIWNFSRVTEPLIFASIDRYNKGAPCFLLRGDEADTFIDTLSSS